MRLLLLLVALAGVACKSDGPTSPSYCDYEGPNNLLLPPTVSGSVTGTFPVTLENFSAGAYHQGSELAQFTVIDAFETDNANRPISELFLFLRSAPALKKVSLVPVTLANLHNPAFVPNGSFAVYAKDYDVTVGDYTKWLIARSGCLRVAELAGGVVGNTRAYVQFSGTWSSNTGTVLGSGAVTANVFTPLVNLANATAPFIDAMSATVAGVRPKPFLASTLDSYQVLRAGQERLVIVATQPADTTRELWLSLAGVPPSTHSVPNIDTIPLEAVTLAEARAGRTDPSRSFAMMRMLTLDNTGHPVVKEIWRSTTGWVHLSRVVQNGPLAICGVVSGTFSVTTQGTSLAAPGTDLGVTTITDGSFDSRISVLAPADSLTDPVTVPASVSRFFLAAPVSKKGTKCP